MPPRKRNTNAATPAVPAEPGDAPATPAVPAKKAGPAAEHLFAYVQVVARAWPGLPAECETGAQAEVTARQQGWTPVGPAYIESQVDHEDPGFQVITWSVPCKASVA